MPMVSTDPALPTWDDTDDAWDDAWVPRVVAGEGAAWRAFHRHHLPVAVLFLRKLGVRDGELDDACQNVFLRAHRCLPAFRGEAQIKTWFYRLCATEAARTRAQRRRVAAALDALCTRQLTAAAASPAATCSDAALADRAWKALRSMKDHERLVLVQYEMEGLAGKTIAAIAGCPVATVWRRLHDARRAFRHALWRQEI
jgi:RNA polymerase sigma-70 factor (ECF subfamily)